MDDAAKISPSVPSICAQNSILSVLIIHIIPSDPIYGANDNPSLFPSICCLTTSCYLRKDVCAADNISHAESLQSNAYRCFTHMYKFRDGIKVTRVFRYSGERAWANQYSTKAPSMFRSLILNTRCSCHWRRQFSPP
jgi:hypothetical protein